MILRFIDGIFFLFISSKYFTPHEFYNLKNQYSLDHLLIFKFYFLFILTSKLKNIFLR